MLLLHFLIQFCTRKYAEYLDLDFDIYNFNSSRNRLLFRKLCCMFYGTILESVPVVVSKIKHHRTDNIQQPLGKSQVLSFFVFFSAGMRRR